MEKITPNINEDYVTINYFGCFDRDTNECNSDSVTSTKEEYFHKSQEIIKGRSTVIDGKYGKVIVDQSNEIPLITFRTYAKETSVSGVEALNELLGRGNLEKLV